MVWTVKFVAQTETYFQTFELVWWLGIAVSAFSALIHLPIREVSLRAAQPAWSIASMTAGTWV